MPRKAAPWRVCLLFKRQRSPGLSPTHARAALAGEGHYMLVAAVICHGALQGYDRRHGARYLPLGGYAAAMDEEDW